MSTKHLYLRPLAMLMVAMCTVISCKAVDSEELSPDLSEIHIKATSSLETKTYIEKEGSVYKPFWSADDKVGLCFDSMESTCITLENSLESGSLAIFVGSASLDAEDIPEQAYAWYPRSAYTSGYNESEGGFNIPEFQHPTLTSFDPAADLLISKPHQVNITVSQSGDTEINLDDLRFARPMAVLKITPDGEGLAGETVKSVSVSSPDSKTLSGRAKVDMTDASIESWTISTSSVTASYSGNDFVVNGENSAYIVVAPAEFESGNQLIITIATETKTATKTIEFAESRALKAGKVTPVVLNISPSDCTENQADGFSGYWLITGEMESTTYAALAYDSGNNLKTQTLTYADGEVTETSDLEQSRMTISKVTEGEYAGLYTIKDAGGLYLHPGSSSSNRLQAQTDLTVHSYWSITENSDGTHSIVASESSYSRNIMQFNYNNGSPLFSCYSKGILPVTLIRYPGNERPGDEGEGEGEGEGGDEGEGGNEGEGGDEGEGGNEGEGEGGQEPDIETESANGKGWMELPAASAQGDYFVGTHYGDSGDRNYTYHYDYDTYTSLWVAYPLYSATMGSLSRPSWNDDPYINDNDEINVWSGSYNVNVGSDFYARGHQIPNNDRDGNRSMQVQTFYATNSTPQIQNHFNGSIWNDLENAFNSEARQVDTMYVVTGAAFRKVGGSETIKYITPKHDSKQCPVPNYYWKVALKVTRNSKGVVTSAKTIGFWMDHREYDSSEDHGDYAVSVDKVEEYTGFDFFVNLPDGIETTAEANSSWSTFIE